MELILISKAALSKGELGDRCQSTHSKAKTPIAPEKDSWLKIMRIGHFSPLRNSS
jgi:hypothetical protein